MRIESILSKYWRKSSVMMSFGDSPRDKKKVLKGSKNAYGVLTYVLSINDVHRHWNLNSLAISVYLVSLPKVPINWHV